MLAVMISIVVVLLFMGLLSYRWLEPVLAVRKGRPVEVRVRSCTKKEVRIGNGRMKEVYYEVTVDLCSLNGEAIVRSLQSRTPYTQGDVIRCRYMDKSGLLLPADAAGEIQTRAKGKFLLLLFFFVVFVGVMVSVLWGMKNGEKKEIHLGSSTVSFETAPVLEVSCYYEDAEREIFNYGVYLEEDGSGHILLFPMKTVTGKNIEQEIKFTVSRENMEKIIQWIQKTDVESLTQGAHRAEETAAYVSLLIYSGEKKYTGGGYGDEGIYKDICGLLREAVPAEVWEEMENREAAYYQR